MIRFFTFALALASFGVVFSPAQPASAMDVIRTRGGSVDINATIRTMSTEEKVAQLLIIGFGGTEATPHIRSWVQKRKVGGVALFSRNIVSLEQTARFTRELFALSSKGAPVFIALDQEGGNVVRVKDGTMLLPSNMALGATRSTTLAYLAGQSLAIDLRRMGFNMNLAPVLDINSNPKNPVIGIRSYGERPELVADLGAWYVRGQQEMGVVAVAKHFPGHGDTREDSHYAMPSISADKTRLEEVELVPFARAMEAGLDAVMTAHISLPNVIKEKEMPATLSHEVLTDILRKRIGFDGIVVTDGLEMRGIIERFGSGKAAVMAILAGADMPMILWTTKKKEEVYQSLLSAVRSGKISMPRLEQSVRRILKVKSKRGLFDLRLEPYERVVKKRNRNPIHEQVAGRIAREAVTLVRNHGDLLPLRAIRYRKAVVLAPAGPFAKRLAQEPNVTVITTPYIPSRSTRKSIIKRVSAEMANADIFIAAAVNRYHLRMIKSISAAASHVPVAMVSLASPYYLSSVPDVDAYLCTYSYLDGAQEAAARAVLGESPMTGRLPISIPGYYPYGHRVEDRMAGAAAKRKDAEASLR